MSELLKLFADYLLPILLTASIGFILQKLLRADPRTLSRIAFYVLSPALVFTLVVSVDIDGGQVVRMMAFAASVVLVTAGIAFLLGGLLGLGSGPRGAYVLSAAFMNAGNYGLPLNLFVFGELGLALASIYFVASLMMTNSLGVYIASVGRGSALDALKGLSRVPALYAIGLAFVVRGQNVGLPTAVSRPIELLAMAAVPALLIVLGMQIATAGLPKGRKLLSTSVAVKLLVAPLAAYFLAAAFGLADLPRQVGILQSAMPTAVLTSVIAIEYEVEPTFVTGAVLLSTALSPLTLTPLIAALGG